MAVEQLSTGGSDGTRMGVSGGKVGFYGTAPVAKQTCNLGTTTTATTTALETSITSILTVLKNLGLITTNV